MPEPAATPVPGDQTTPVRTKRPVVVARRLRSGSVVARRMADGQVCVFIDLPLRALLETPDPAAPEGGIARASATPPASILETNLSPVRPPRRSLRVVSTGAAVSLAVLSGIAAGWRHPQVAHEPAGRQDPTPQREIPMIAEERDMPRVDLSPLPAKLKAEIRTNGGVIPPLKPAPRPKMMPGESSGWAHAREGAD